MIANSTEAVGVRLDAGGFARLADRWIYVFMAALFEPARESRRLRVVSQATMADSRCR